MATEFIFDPERVGETLKGFPSLSRKLGDPAKEERTNSFPYARKSSRQIYGVLSNTHYPHLMSLLRALDECIADGWEQPTLIRTRAQKEFGSAVAELLVADNFRKRGFAIESFDNTKGSDSVPDIFIRGKNLALCAEVYCPRDWDGMNHFEDDLTLGVEHLDAPYDFQFKITLCLLKEFDPEGRRLLFDPWEFSEATEKGEVKTQPILAEVQGCLAPPAKREATVCSREECHNILIQVHLKEIETGKGRVPSRWGSVFPPTLTGYAPELMFDQLVTRRISKKLKKRQALILQGQHIRALIVDVSGLGYTSVFEQPCYLGRFGKSLRAHISSDLLDVDLVLFVLPRADDGITTRWPLVLRKPHVTDEVLNALVGGDKPLVVDCVANPNAKLV
jgi:hypothetical protein